MDENKEMNAGAENPENEAQTYGEPEQPSYGEAEQPSYGEPEQPSYGETEQQTYGEPEQQSYYSNPGQQSYYGQPDQAYGQPDQTYGQTDQTYGQQSYGQTDQTYGQQSYGQTSYDQQFYGQSNYNAAEVPLDKNGQPLKNNYGMKMAFSIIEVLWCCCGCNFVTMIMGIVGCVFSSQANAAYKEGRWEEFRSKSKTTNIFLWIGFGFAVVGMIANILMWTVGGFGEAFMTGFEEGYNSTYEDIYDSTYDDYYDSYDDTDSYDEDPVDVPDADVPAAPQEVTPGEGFTDPTITVNGGTITFPMSYGDFAAAGFSVDSEDAEYVINKNEYYNPTFYDAAGMEVGEVYIGNETDGALPMNECVVFGVNIDSYVMEDGTTFSLPNGLTQDSTVEDFMKAFGTPDYDYDGDDYESYQWYNHNDEYYDAEENSISVDFWEGGVDELDMRYIGWN